MQKLGFWSAAAVVLVIFAFIEWRASQNKPAPPIAQTAVTSTIRADLMKIARVQQFFYSEHGRYGSIQELIDSGGLAMKTPGRGVYIYTTELTETGFVVTARARGEEAGRWPVLFITERMEIEERPPGFDRK